MWASPAAPSPDVRIRPSPRRLLRAVLNELAANELRPVQPSRKRPAASPMKYETQQAMAKRPAGLEHMPQTRPGCWPNAMVQPSYEVNGWGVPTQHPGWTYPNPNPVTPNRTFL